MIELPAPNNAKTTRQRFEEHLFREDCADCHSTIDPIGFSFENYDGLGRYRATENGYDIDASSEVTGMEDPNLNGFINDSRDLVNRMVDSRQVYDCISEQFFRFSVGRVLRWGQVLVSRRFGAVLGLGRGFSGLAKGDCHVAGVCVGGGTQSSRRPRRRGG